MIIYWWKKYFIMNIPYEMFLTIQLMHLNCRKDRIQSPTRKEGWDLFQRTSGDSSRNNPKWRMMTRMRCRRPEGKFVVSSIWIYNSLKLFLSSWCFWSWELQIHVYWSNSWFFITYSLEQVSSSFSCKWLYRSFPSIQMHQFHG